MAQLNFDASQVAPNTGVPDAFPAGWYNAAIDESEMKPTKDGTGTYLQVRYSVLDGQYQGRKVYQRLNLRNSNPVAQEIAYGELSAICHATGIMQVQDSQQFHNVPLKIKVKLRPADGQYEASNEISAVKHINEQVGDAGAPAGGAAPSYQAPVANQAPQQQPAQQPWAGQQQAPAQQPAPQQAPVDQQQQNWQQPAAQQPWQEQQQQPAQQPAQQPFQQPAPQQQAPAQQPVQQPAQQPAQQPQTTAQPPASAGMPPWAQGQQ